MYSLTCNDSPWAYVHMITYSGMLYSFKDVFHFLREDMDTKEVNFIA